MARRYRWNPTPKAFMNLGLISVITVLILYMIISSIVHGVQSGATKRKYRKLSTSINTYKEAYESQGYSFPSGVVLGAYNAASPEAFNEYAWLSQNQDLMGGVTLASISSNPEMIHYMYQLKNFTYKPSESMALTAQETEERIPFLYQWDNRWGFESYGNSTIGLAGSGPTCLSMAVIGLTGDTSINPLVVATYGANNGHYYWDSGSTAWTLISQGSKNYGLNVRETWLDESNLKNCLDNGEILIMVVGKGHFDVAGAFILVSGYDSEGFIVHDTDSIANSQQRWTYDDIRKEILAIWALGY